MALGGKCSVWVLITLLSGCTGTQETDSNANVEALWCLGLCQLVEVGMDAETHNEQDIEEIQEDEE